MHPSRSLRFFLTAWLGTNAGFIIVHLIDGSVGTKGEGWAGKGLLIDFVGQGQSGVYGACCGDDVTD